MNMFDRKFLLGLVVVFSSMGGAMAQTPTQPNTPAPQNGNSNDSEQAEVRTQHASSLSGPEQLREADSVLEIVTGMRRRVSDMLDHARLERDIIKVNCLNDKLTQLDVTLRSAREHQELLSTAVSISNDGQRNHEFTLLSIFRSHAQDLENEAQLCVGEDPGVLDRSTIVTLGVDPGITERDTTQLTPESLAPERPLVTSPVM